MQEYKASFYTSIGLDRETHVQSFRPSRALSDYGYIFATTIITHHQSFDRPDTERCVTMLLPTALITLLAVNTALALPVAMTYNPEYLTPRTWNKVAEMLPTFKREKDFDSYGRYTVFTFKPGDPWLSKANSGDPKMKGQFLDVGNVCSILLIHYKAAPV